MNKCIFDSNSTNGLWYELNENYFITVYITLRKRKVYDSGFTRVGIGNRLHFLIRMCSMIW